jgi:hypothetical protein
MATRYNINDFALANPAYAGGTVSFYTVSGGAKTTTLATLYAASTGTTTLANPRTLDSDGKFSVPVYVEVPTVATVSGLTVADHDTGIMGLTEGAASTSAAAAAASAAAALVSQSAAGVSAAAALVSENNAAATLAAALPKAGGNLTGGINSARGNITQHATTMDFFAVTSPDILDGTGSAVTITACTNAPQAGATRMFYPIVATVLTHGATFDIAGNANLTAAAGDCWIIEAKTVSTYRVTAVKEDGTAVVGLATALKSATTSVDVSAATAPSTGQVLKATSSTTATWQDGGGITLGTPVASTSGTAINFTSIPAGTKRITVMFSLVSTNGTSNMMIQIGDSGGLEATGYTSASITAATSDGETTGFQVANGIGAAELLSGSVRLTLVSSATNTWASSGALTNGGTVIVSAGDKSLSAALDRVTITTVAGTDTFDAGVINISYE